MVEAALCHGFNSSKIRAEHIELSRMFRLRFYDLLRRLGDTRGVRQDWGPLIEGKSLNQMCRFEDTEVVLDKIR